MPERLAHLHYVDLFAPDGYELLARTLNFEKEKVAVGDRLEADASVVTKSQAQTIEQIREFVQQAGLEDVTRVCVITHTGGVTLNALIRALERGGAKEEKKVPIQLQVLLRSTHLSDLARAQGIERSISALREFSLASRNFNVEARSYASPPLLRCIILEHQGAHYSAYLSFYDWPIDEGFNQRGAANQRSFLGIRLTSDHWLLGMFLSWFKHLWGGHRIQTLLFDFDDTLFLTTECQVKGWIEALRTAIDGKTFSISDLAPDIRKMVERRADLTSLMTAIFLDEQQEQEILRRLFNKLPSLSKLELLRRHRMRVREELTAQNAIPISQIINDIQALSADYQMAIISATSENLVRQVLDRHGLSKLFSYIIGRDAPRQNWQAMENKTQQFLRVSNMTGVPLERMVFVGDFDADYKSAAQLGLHFIENRMNATRHNRRSLIKSLDPEGHPFLTGNPGELSSAIQKIEARVHQLP